MSRYRNEHDDRDRSQQSRPRDRSHSRDRRNSRSERDIEKLHTNANPRSRSGDRHRSRSHDRRRSRSGDRRRSRSGDRHRSWSGDRRRSRSRDWSTAYNKRRRSSRSRSRSPRQAKREMKAERRNEYDYNNDAYYDKEEIDYIGYGVDSTHLKNLTEEEKVAVKSCYCALCEVTLGDPASMLGHVRGMKHIQAKKDKGIMKPDVLEDNNQVDTKYWIKQENEAKKKIASNDPVYDLSKIAKIPAKFNARTYDHGQFKKDLYCDICGVTVHSRDTFENHIQGAEHKRRAEKPKKFECKLCYINVPCQNSLNSHFQGKDHIKRVNEIRKRKGIGYDGNAQAPNSISGEEEREYKQLEKRIKILQRDVERLSKRDVECKKKHKDYDKLLIKKNDLQKDIIFYKKQYEDECKAPKQPIKKKEESDVPKADIKGSKINKKEEYLHPDQINVQVVDEKKVKAEFKPKKEEFEDKEYVVYDVIDIDD